MNVEQRYEMWLSKWTQISGLKDSPDLRRAFAAGYRHGAKDAKQGEEPTRGRPKTLDDAKVSKLHKAGKSLAEIAKKFGVTRGAVQAALKR